MGAEMIELHDEPLRYAVEIRDLCEGALLTSLRESAVSAEAARGWVAPYCWRAMAALTQESMPPLRKSTIAWREVVIWFSLEGGTRV